MPLSHYFKHSIRAWLVWAGITVALYAGDYGMRMRDGNPRTTGIEETVLFGAMWVLSAGCMVLLYRDLGSRPPAWKKILWLAACGAIGFVVYAFGTLIYVLEAGIDSL